MATVNKKGTAAITNLNPMAIIRKKRDMHVTTRVSQSQKLLRGLYLPNGYS
jgi:hypothetical protein